MTSPNPTTQPIQFSLQAVASGTIYANPYPADWPLHAWYPMVAVLPSGDLICECRLGSAMYSDDGHIVQFRSTDRGESWTRELVVRDTSHDPKPSWCAPSGISHLGGNHLLLTGFRIHRPKRDMPTCNDATGACLPEETFIMRSTDAGRSWNEIAVVQKPAGVFLEAYGGVMVLRDGRWLQVFDVSKAYDDPAPTKACIVCLTSSDEGKTWQGPFPIAGSLEASKTFWHMRVTKMRDGRILGFAWTGDESGQNFLGVHRVESDVDGGNWSEPHDTGLPGQTNCPVDLGNGRVAIIYTRRGGDAPGFYVALSTDEGRTFDLDRQVQVWDTYGRESLGAPRTATYPSSHDNIAFGAPNLVALADNELLASFWAVVAGQTVCRWARVMIK